jgi:hypothetical protein
MDQRETFGSDKNLLAALAQIQQQHSKASLLVDDNGLTRMEGLITSIEENNRLPQTLIGINNQRSFELKNIIAVNGQFRADYSEC